MGDSAHTTHHTNPGNSIPHGTNEADFWEMFSSFRKRGGADAFEKDPVIYKQTHSSTTAMTTAVASVDSTAAVYSSTTKFSMY